MCMLFLSALTPCTLNYWTRGRAGVKKGVETLRKLGFDIPTNPTFQHVIRAMASVDEMVSEQNLDLERITDLCHNVEESTQAIMQIYDATYLSMVSSSSLFCKCPTAWTQSRLSLSHPHSIAYLEFFQVPITCSEIIKYSLKHGIHKGASTAFATFGVLKIKLEKDYKAGRNWGAAARAISGNGSSESNINVNMIWVREMKCWLVAH